MSLISITRNFRSSCHFLLAALMIWPVFMVVIDIWQTIAWQQKLLFMAINISGGFFLLWELGYFRRLRLSPRKSDLLMLVAVILVVNMASRSLWHFLLDDLFISQMLLLLGSPFLAIAIFGFECVIAELAVLGRPRRKIVINLLAHEREQLIRDFAELGMAERLQFLSAADLKRYLLQRREREIALIVISRKALASDQLDPVLVRAHIAGIPIVDHHKVSADLTGRIRLNDVDQWVYLLQATRQTALLRAYGRAKRILEPIAALLLTVLFSPIIIIVAILIKLSSKGPVLYRQVRTGYLGKEFVLLKFRSMLNDSEKSGPRWSWEGDERVTFFGRFLRRTRLDELPQLWNIFRGEMSFIGPRPERPEFYRELKQHIPLFPVRTMVKPGVTGWAQVCGGYAASVAESIIKLEYDLYYLKHISPRLDLIILIKTFFVMLVGSERRPDLRDEQPLAVASNGSQVSIEALVGNDYVGSEQNRGRRLGPLEHGVELPI